MVQKKSNNESKQIIINKGSDLKIVLMNFLTIKKIGLIFFVLFAINIQFNIVPIGPVNIHNNTVIIKLNPVESDFIDNQEIIINQKQTYSSLPFQAILSKDNLSLNPDVVYIYNMDSPPPYFGDRFDSVNIHDKGTIEIWMRPEWYGDDNAAHYFVDMGENVNKNRITLYKDKDNSLKLRIIDNSNIEYLVERYVGNETRQNDIGLDWKPNQFYHLAATWDFNNGELELFCDKTLVDMEKYDEIPFNFENTYQFILGNGLEIIDNPDWAKSNCADFNEKCGFSLDELTLWKSKRTVSQIITNQFIAQYTSNVMEFSKSAKFQEIELFSDNPIGTSFLLHSRSSKDGIVWSNWELAPYNNGKYTLNSPEGQFLQIELILSRIDTNQTISLKNINEIELTMSI